jgi:hypothetical protein
MKVSSRLSKIQDSSCILRKDKPNYKCLNITKNDGHTRQFFSSRSTCISSEQMYFECYPVSAQEGLKIPLKDCLGSGFSFGRY